MARGGVAPKAAAGADWVDVDVEYKQVSENATHKLNEITTTFDQAIKLFTAIYGGSIYLAYSLKQLSWSEYVVFGVSSIAIVLAIAYTAYSRMVFLHKRWQGLRDHAVRLIRPPPDRPTTEAPGAVRQPGLFELKFGVVAAAVAYAVVNPFLMRALFAPAPAPAESPILLFMR